MPSVNDTTELPIWTIRPTPLERAMGRLMRGPDHGADGGEGSGDAGASDGGDAEGGSDAGEGSDGGDEGDASSLLGGASAGAGDADQGSGESGEGDGDDKAKAAAEGPPEAYELSIKVAGEDGAEQDVEIDAALLADATPIFKEIGLTNEQANKIAPLAIKVQEKFLQQISDDHEARKNGWAQEVKADLEIGGKNWKETETLAARALDTFGAPEGSEFRKLLDETGLGNHPVMVRMFREIGEKVGEGGEFVRGDKGAQQKPDRLAALYPEDVKK